jgi:hypothetical protein
MTWEALAAAAAILAAGYALHCLRARSSDWRRSVAADAAARADATARLARDQWREAYPAIARTWRELDGMPATYRPSKTEARAADARAAVAFADDASWQAREAAHRLAAAARDARRAEFLAKYLR